MTGKRRDIDALGRSAGKPQQLEKRALRSVSINVAIRRVTACLGFKSALLRSYRSTPVPIMLLEHAPDGMVNWDGEIESPHGDLTKKSRVYYSASLPL